MKVLLSDGPFGVTFISHETFWDHKNVDFRANRKMFKIANTFFYIASENNKKIICDEWSHSFKIHFSLQATSWNSKTRLKAWELCRWYVEKRRLKFFLSLSVFLCLHIYEFPQVVKRCFGIVLFEIGRAHDQGGLERRRRFGQGEGQMDDFQFETTKLLSNFKIVVTKPCFPFVKIKGKAK